MYYDRYKDRKKPFGDNAAEVTANGIQNYIAQMVDDYRRQYGFLITNMSITEERTSVGEIYFTRLTMIK